MKRSPVAWSIKFFKLPAVGIALFAFVGMAAGCADDKVSVPKVVDVGLDKAKESLKNAGLDNQKEVDALGDRTALIDSNWVVVAQDPSPGTAIDKDTTVTLRIAKPGDPRFLEVAPSGSMAAQKEQEKRDAAARAQQEKEAAAKEEADRKRAAAAAKESAEIKAYVDTIDPATRLGKGAIDELAQFASAAEAGSENEDAVVAYTRKFNETMDSYKSFLDARGNPDTLEGQTDALKSSVEGFVRASRTLGSLIGTDDAATMKRFRDVYAESRTTYNTALRQIYASTSVQPPTIQ